MRILIYKRTHVGDPDVSGKFGIHGCMGAVRGYHYDAVIGVGGMGVEPRSYGIDGRINWIGIGPKKEWSSASQSVDPRGPLVRFEKYRLWEDKGPPLHIEAPMLARRLYEGNARFLLGSLSVEEQREAESILRLVDGPSELQAKKAIDRHCVPKVVKRNCPPRRRC